MESVRCAHNIVDSTWTFLFLRAHNPHILINQICATIAAIKLPPSFLAVDVHYHRRRRRCMARVVWVQRI